MDGERLIENLAYTVNSFSPDTSVRRTPVVGHFTLFLIILFTRAIFTWVSKVICVYFGFALLRSVIGLKISRHFLDQSEVKPKPITSKTKTNRDLLAQVFLYLV